MAILEPRNEIVCGGNDAVPHLARIAQKRPLRLSDLLLIKELLTQILSFLPLSDLSHVCLSSKSFYNLVKNKTPLSVTFMDEIKEDQQKFIQNWTFRALNVRFKQNHLLNAAEIQRVRHVLREWEIAVARREELLRERQRSRQMRQSVSFEDNDLTCAVESDSDADMMAPEMQLPHTDMRRISQSSVVVPPAENLGMVPRSATPPQDNIAVLHPDGQRTILSQTDFTELRNICSSLITMINRNHRLETIMLTNLHLDEAGTEQILKALEGKKSLKRLSMGSFKCHAPLTSTVTNALCTLLSTNHAIKEVGFKALNPSSDETILQVLQALKAAQIDQLSLHRDPITAKVGKKISCIIQRGNIKALRLLIFPQQPAEGCTQVFNALAQSDSADRLLFGGCLENENPEVQHALAKYIKNTRSLKLLHFIDFADWSDKQPVLLNALTENKSLFILKLQFASRTPTECHRLLLALKPTLMYHPTLVKVTLENACLNAECYELLADVVKHNERLKVIHLLSVNHVTDQDTQIMNALVKLREVLMHNETLQNMKIVPTDSFLRNTSIMVLYYQIIALCAKNATQRRTKQEQERQQVRDQLEMSRCKRKRAKESEQDEERQHKRSRIEQRSVEVQVHTATPTPTITTPTLMSSKNSEVPGLLSSPLATDGVVTDSVDYFRVDCAESDDDDLGRSFVGTPERSYNKLSVFHNEQGQTF